MYSPNPHELNFEDELGGRLGKKIKKKLKKAVAVVATGGLAAAPMLIKKAKKAKVAKAAAKVKAVAAKAGQALGVKVAITPKAKIAPKPAAKAAPRPAPKPAVIPANVVRVTPKAAQTLAKVATKTAGDCTCMNDMVKLVTAQLVAKLGGPLATANKHLKLAELQREATYEHKKLMTDQEFRRKVMELLTLRAANGNQSCERTVRVLMNR